MNKDEAKLKYMEVIFKGFVIAPNKLIKEKDLITAAVWGRIWSFTQMSDGQCSAALDKLAGLLGISYRTVMRRAEWLVENGYIVDKTPGRRNAPHEYVCTTKIIPSFAFGIEEGVTESHTEVRQRVTPRYDRESVEDIPLINSLINKPLKDANTKPASFKGEPRYVPEDGEFSRKEKPAKKEKAPVVKKTYEAPANYGAFEELGLAFESVIGRRPASYSEWVFWMNGSDAKRVKGLKHFYESKISPEIMKLAGSRLVKDEITISNPNTLYNTAFQLQKKVVSMPYSDKKKVEERIAKGIEERSTAKKVQIVDGKVQVV